MSPTKIHVLSTLIGWSGAVAIYAAIDTILWPEAWFDWLLTDIFLSLAFFPMTILLTVSLVGLHRVISVEARGWNCVTAALAGAAMGTVLTYGVALIFMNKHHLPIVSDSLGAYEGTLIFGVSVWLRRKYWVEAVQKRQGRTL